MTRPRNPELPRKILNEAEKIVAERGHHAINMRSLARNVGITATTIYHYFKSKDDLMLKLRLRIAEMLNGKIRAIDPALSPHETLLALGKAYIQFAEENPRFYKLFLEEKDESPSLKRKDRAVLYFTYYTARNALERMAASGEHPVDPGIGAMMGWVMLHGFCSLLIAGKLQLAEDMDREALKAAFFGFYGSGGRMHS